MPIGIRDAFSGDSPYPADLAGQLGYPTNVHDNREPAVASFKTVRIAEHMCNR